MDTITPEPLPQKAFTDPLAAWSYVSEIYHRNTGFIRAQLLRLTKGHVPKGRVRAFYPEVQVTSRSYGKTASTLPYGYLHTPGLYRTTITAPRVDYSLARLSHYTGTDADHFQNFVIFTNYGFYMDEFARTAQRYMQEGHPEYESFVEPGGFITRNSRLGGGTSGARANRAPQMPALHLTMPRNRGITIVNIGVGPSNAKTATDHIAVLRPHAWIMLGHCAGLRNSQELGDYVLAHAYLRQDHVLDADLPVTVPIPALAEVQVALEQAVREITHLEGIETKRIMRTGTVATFDNRN